MQQIRHVRHTERFLRRTDARVHLLLATDANVDAIPLGGHHLGSGQQQRTAATKGVQIQVIPILAHVLDKFIYIGRVLQVLTKHGLYRADRCDRRLVLEQMVVAVMSRVIGGWCTCATDVCGDALRFCEWEKEGLFSNFLMNEFADYAREVHVKILCFVCDAE